MKNKLSSLWEGIVNFSRVIVTNKQATFGAFILIIFTLMAILGPIMLTPDKANYVNRLQGSSFQHLLGTDFAGKDTLKQFILGSREVLTIALYAGVFTLSIGVTVGITSGLLGGIVDDILMMITNVVQTIPNFPVLMVMSLIVNIDSSLKFGLILSIWSWAGLARAVRSQTLSLKNRDFIEASRILGMSKIYIIINDILPNIISYIAVNFIMIMKSSILASVGLMVLGLAPFKGDHWGIMLDMALNKTGALFGSKAIIYLLTPIVGIVLFQLGCFMFSKGLEDAFNPRIKTTIAIKRKTKVMGV
ncbi:ABC transporter permease [Clostridium sp. CM028]|uniref:ABC transporter permease n=1 Tax=unclassified Clostridium TaxID=2614128 RepID=UPI001C0AE83D|nr:MULTISPECIES: ABC transporter permease [unclassified Clostridium]MBU3092609.1 ABC transporter permease [Clostridium sp. CF011]MBW9149662.1 ABC transporter permease [Clostridium sp. CM028]WAG68737.1 ABC transporter permease [Clostridium sp. CF011]WLC60527.1 ABC transporter permease [Clostridium sp. CM028]